MIHELKILPEYFEAIISGEKTFEVRKANKPFKVGDLLALNEHDGDYTGNSCVVYVDYILHNADYCKDGYIVMSVKPCTVFKHKAPFDCFGATPDYGVPYATRKENAT